MRIVIVVCGAALFAGCDKTNLQPVTQVKIRLAGGPLTAQQVNVQVKQVRVNLSDDTTWITLHTNATSYNLLDYTNGKDTLIAEGNMLATKIIKQLQIVLGDSNTIKTDNQLYPLNLTAGAGTINIVVNSKLNKNIETLTLNFNAAASITETAKGSYQLTPVVTLKD